MTHSFKPEVVEKVARALSIPQHHTTWDTLSEMEKDLFYMQADYALSIPEIAALYEALENAHLALEYWQREATVCGKGAKWIEGPLERNRFEFRRKEALTLFRVSDNG